ncbi:endonuclease VIII [Candidatus Dojkabacteria bacterium]|nr:endonuclease VIII [Candidatus Dojkabacteria bacterium]
MIEIPEAVVLTKQINNHVKDKKVKKVTAVQNPHKLAWYFKDPQGYPKLLTGKQVTDAYPVSGAVEIALENSKIVFSEGVNIRYIEDTKDLPQKHQLLLEFDDGTFFAAWVQMYGAIACFNGNEYDNKYYLLAKSKPSPLSSDFTEDYWKSLFTQKTEKLSAKAFLATEQRIPGLGNGVLQDILFNAGIYPKRKMNTLSEQELTNLYSTVKSTLNEMVENNGRDTEKDLFGNPGNYKTRMSAKTAGNPCPKCKSTIKKMAYMGGSVYFCEKCQPLD